MKKLPEFVQAAIAKGEDLRKREHERCVQEDKKKRLEEQDKWNKQLEDARYWVKNLMPYGIESAVAGGKNMLLLGTETSEAKARVQACQEIGMEVKEIEDIWDGPGGDISYFVCW